MAPAEVVKRAWVAYRDGRGWAKDSPQDLKAKITAGWHALHTAAVGEPAIKTPSPDQAASIARAVEAYLANSKAAADDDPPA